MSQTMGAKISELRKGKGLTQAQLAEQMAVTDKAVSKWERDLSCPDISSIPKLAEILGVSVEQLMQGEAAVPAESKSDSPLRQLFPLILKSVALAMGVAVAVLSIMEKIDLKSAMVMLALGLSALALLSLQEKF